MNNKYTRRPKSNAPIPENKFEKYSLRENPFPASPTINPNSTDNRVNGGIYEPSIRENEYDRILNNFIKVSQSDHNHLRLGYILDTSYIGRGNGKSAFIVNMQRDINKDFALTLSNELNKCFSIRLRPEGGGLVKTFEQFVELFVGELFASGIILDALASLRLATIIQLNPEFQPEQHFQTDSDIRSKLSDAQWFKNIGVDYRKIAQEILSNEYLQTIPDDFPLSTEGNFFEHVATQEDFVRYYKALKRGKPQLEFVFTDLVNVFLAAGFNGAYIFVDDFERIPDFQSGRQRKDFATQLRSCLLDGAYTNASIGFYNLILVLHAGVQGMIQEAWELSGLEHRAPLTYARSGQEPSHIILFEKITKEDTFALISKYLDAYRTDNGVSNSRLYPFTEATVTKIAEANEYNCTRILKSAFEALDKASSQNIEIITPEFVQENDEGIAYDSRPKGIGIHNAPTKNLLDEE